MPHLVITGVTRVLAALVVSLMVLTATALSSQAQRSTPQAAEFFYDSLQPEGRWVEHRDYGLVWYPTEVDREWRPYSRGHWVNTEEYGWYWESYERFGWATGWAGAS